MKKFFLFLLTLVIVGNLSAASVAENVSTVHDDVKTVMSTLHQDTKDAISTLYGDGKEVSAVVYSDVKSALVSIAKALGIAAEHVYVVLVKKYVVEGITQLVPCIFGLILLIIGLIKLSKYAKESTRLEWHSLLPLSFIITGIIFLSIVKYETMFMGLINPEYGAINYILEFTKGMVK